jgi:hypothetical protein
MNIACLGKVPKYCKSISEILAEESVQLVGSDLEIVCQFRLPWKVWYLFLTFV